LGLSGALGHRRKKSILLSVIRVASLLGIIIPVILWSRFSDGAPCLPLSERCRRAGMDALKNLPALKRISGTKKLFKEDQLTGFPDTVKIN
jgi:hypothetical protein